VDEDSELNFALTFLNEPGCLRVEEVKGKKDKNIQTTVAYLDTLVASPIAEEEEFQWINRSARSILRNTMSAEHDKVPPNRRQGERYASGNRKDKTTAKTNRQEAERPGKSTLEVMKVNRRSVSIKL